MPAPRINFDQIQVGDFLSEVQYYKVSKVAANEITVKNERGYPIEVTRGVVEEGMSSASQFTEEQKVTRTQLCEILEKAGDTVFTVCFHKKIKEKDVANTVVETLSKEEQGVDQKTLEKHIRSAIKQALQGEERHLVGYLIRTEAKMGRSEVIDLEAEGNHRIRLVDHRTLDWIILKGTKYSLR